MNSYDKIMLGKIIIPFQEVLIDLPETLDEPMRIFARENNLLHPSCLTTIGIHLR